MLDHTVGIREQHERLPEGGFVESAANAPRARIGRHRRGDLEEDRTSLTDELTIHVAPRELPENAERNGAGQERREAPGGAKANTADAVDRRPGPPTTGLAKGDVGIGAPSDQPGKRQRFIEGNPLPGAHRVGIAPDLLRHRVTQPKALVAELVDKVRVPLRRRGVDGSDGLKEDEWQARIDRTTGQGDLRIGGCSGAGEPAVGGQ